MNSTLRNYAGAVWMMENSAFAYWNQVVRDSVKRGIAGEPIDEQKDPRLNLVQQIAAISQAGSNVESARLFLGRPRYVKYDQSFRSGEDQIVNYLAVTGPITREQNCDNVGSKRYRDLIIEAADDDDCVGTLIVIDTPGGSADSMPDFKEAIAYSEKLGKPVVAFVDGMAASLGYGLLSQCREAYFRNPENRVGCIGTMINYYTLKNGEKNSVSGHVYHELVSKLSPNKNLDFRESAEGNDERMTNLLDDYASRFIADIKRGRPTVTDEQTKGDMYLCSAVTGTMIDGQSTLLNAAMRVVELSSHAKKSGSGRPGASQNTNIGAAASVTTDSPADTTGSNADKPENDTEGSPKQISNMNNFERITGALQVEELAIADGGAFLNEEQLSVIEAALGIRPEAEAANATLIAEKEVRIAELEQQLKEKEEAIAANATLITEKEARIAALETEVQELADSAPDESAPQPANDNAGSAPDPNSTSVLRPGMSPQEEAEAVAKEREALRKKGF